MTSPSKKSASKAPSAQSNGALGPCPIPKESPLTILIDTREPLESAYKFPDEALTERLKLEEGDYTIKGFEGIIAVERKTLSDFASSILLDRYWNEIGRAREKGYKSFIIVIEGTMGDIHQGKYRSEVKPASLFGAISALAVRGIPAILCDSRPMAAHYTYTYLKHCWERRYKGVFWPLPEPKEPKK